MNGTWRPGTIFCQAQPLGKATGSMLEFRVARSVFHVFFLAVWCSVSAGSPHLLFFSKQRSGVSAILLVVARETRQHLGAFLGTSSLAWTRFLFTVWQRCSVCCVEHGIRQEETCRHCTSGRISGPANDRNTQPPGGSKRIRAESLRNCPVRSETTDFRGESSDVLARALSIKSGYVRSLLVTNAAR